VAPSNLQFYYTTLLQVSPVSYGINGSMYFPVVLSWCGSTLKIIIPFQVVLHLI